MRKISLKNSALHNHSRGLLSCKDCGRTICTIGNNLRGFKISFVCTCSSMGKAEVNAKKLNSLNCDTAVLKNGHLFCPVCNSELIALNPKLSVNLAFRIGCGCGAVFDKYKEHSALNHRILEYINRE